MRPASVSMPAGSSALTKRSGLGHLKKKKKKETTMLILFQAANMYMIRSVI